MKVWAVAVVVFFGAAELYQWLQNLTLPLPVYGAAGLLLAIASNADHWYRPQPKASPQLDSDSATLPNPTALSPQAPVSPVPSKLSPPSAHSNSVQLPNFTPTTQPSISFTIPEQKQK